MSAAPSPSLPPAAHGGLPVALTCGEPAGIGPELAARVAALPAGTVPSFFWIGDPAHLPAGTPVSLISHPGEAAAVGPGRLAVLAHPFDGPARPGQPDPRHAGAVIDVIARAVDLVRHGHAAAVCTAPISKKALKDGAGFAFPGHTEFLAHLAGVERVVMMLACPELRVVPVTIHIPLAEVPGALTPALLEATLRLTEAGLQRDFGLPRPRLAVAGLNPHAGEGGAMGHEEATLITPVLDRLRGAGMQIAGPLPADTLFHPAARARYDAAVCMYHDQALIPIKTLDFAGGVNVTLGLPFVRTSPDHGTAFDIAGRGLADPTSLVAALRLAADMARARSTAPLPPARAGVEDAGGHPPAPGPKKRGFHTPAPPWDISAEKKGRGRDVAAIDGLPPLREVIRAHDLVARRQLGQNFLLDLNLTAKIARLAGDLAGADVLEVGPGPGGLTRGLLAEGARRVLAVEKDARCLPALEEIAAHWPGRLQVVQGDALDLDVAALLRPPVKVVANLPYNVGTELLVRWLTPQHWPPFWDSLTLMFQKEVAERIVARPGSKAYGRLALLAQWRCEARIVLVLPPEAFTPAPKVHSAVVHLTRLEAPRFAADGAVLSRLTAAAFNQRRKMLRSSLKGLAPGIEAHLRAAGIDPTARAEEIGLEQFCALARLLAAGPMLDGAAASPVGKGAAAGPVEDGAAAPGDGG